MLAFPIISRFNEKNQWKLDIERSSIFSSEGGKAILQGVSGGIKIYEWVDCMQTIDKTDLFWINTPSHFVNEVRVSIKY